MSEKGTEQASPQHKKKAREKGDNVRSRELLSAAGMLGGILMLGVAAREFSAGWATVYFESLHFETLGDARGEQDWISFVYRTFGHVRLATMLILAASFGFALAAGVAQSGGVSINMNLLAPKYTRLSLVTNLQNMVNLRSVTRLAKSLLPVSALLCLSWMELKKLMLPMPVMSLLRLPETFSTTYKLALDAAWILLVWGGLDYATEWRSWNDRLKMSKQQVREEMRDSLGNPQIKGKIRQIQRAMRKRKVKADMSRASVVITNPTHYAVALEFSFETMQAPTVLTKGRDLHAAEIREEARWAGVPIIENPPLARSLYRLAEPGQSIPVELYSTVAGILAYLYRQQVEQRKNERDKQPEYGYQVMAGGGGMRNFGGGL
jgi:flagellar biosynthesis protein FlhB